jgi:hypothetical protein
MWVKFSSCSLNSKPAGVPLQLGPVLLGPVQGRAQVVRLDLGGGATQE